jgi:hypothetical protein
MTALQIINVLCYIAILGCVYGIIRRLRANHYKDW